MRQILAFTLILAAMTAYAGNLEDEIRTIVGDDRIGVAVITETGDTIEVNGHETFPLMSVVKFHQAVAVGEVLGYPDIAMRRVPVEDSDLHRDTWSPMLERFPNGLTSVDVPTLLRFSLVESDNNAADLLFRHIVSPESVDSIVRGTTPAHNFAVSRTEAEMQADPHCAAENYSTPLDAATLISHYFLSDTTKAATYIKAIMAADCPTGIRRLQAGLGEGAKLFHKTGTGHADSTHCEAVNDAGFVLFKRSDGRLGYYSIAVFVRDFDGSPTEAEARIAEISSAAWRHLGAEVPVSLSALGKSAPAVGTRQRPGAPATEENSYGSAAALMIIATIAEAVASHGNLP